MNQKNDQKHLVAKAEHELIKAANEQQLELQFFFSKVVSSVFWFAPENSMCESKANQLKV